MKPTGDGAIKSRAWIVGLCGAACAAACGAAGPAAAAATDLVWSFSYADVQKATGCGATGPCPATLTRLAGAYDIGFRGTFQGFDVGDYGGPDFGSSWASAAVGAANAAGYVLPELKAYSAAHIVGQEFGWNLAGSQGVTGFKNTSGGDLEVPVDAFIGSMDFTGTGGAQAGNVLVGLALTTNAIIGNDAVGIQWFEYGNGSAFSASCATTGALAIANGAVTPAGPAGSATVAATGCGGSSFSLSDGEEFFIWAKLSAFRAGEGITDAAHTFTLAFNPAYAGTEVETRLTAGLEQIENANVGVAVPEPSTWALLIAGFGGIGAVMRRRKAALA